MKNKEQKQKRPDLEDPFFDDMEDSEVIGNE